MPPTFRPKRSVPQHDDHRPSAARRGYGSNWRRRREQVLSREPLCRSCSDQGKTVEATDVDHIVPLADGGDHSDDNLQPLCHECHSRKTATMDGGLGKPKTRHNDSG